MNEALQRIIQRNDTWQGNEGRFAGRLLSANGDRYREEAGLPTAKFIEARQLQDRAAQRRLRPGRHGPVPAHHGTPQ